MINNIGVTDVLIDDVTTEALVLQTHFEASDSKIAFINKAISDFKNQKMVSDPSINHFLIYLSGSMSLSEFLELWKQYAQKDAIAVAFLNVLVMAMVFHVDSEGEVLESEDLLMDNW